MRKSNFCENLCKRGNEKNGIKRKEKQIKYINIIDIIEILL